MPTNKQLKELEVKIESLTRIVNEMTALSGGILSALVDGGVITEREFDKHFAQATSDIDQEIARQRDAAEGNGKGQLYVP